MAEATSADNQGTNKRRSPIMVELRDAKKSKPSPRGPPTTPLPSHDALLAELRSKYDVLPAFTISSTKIQKRVNWLLLHLRKDNGDARKRAVLIYARPGEVGKMISICEQAKRIVAEEDGSRWYQYNKMFELPPKAEVVEDTILAGSGGDSGGEEDSHDDDFEVMKSRFEKAVLPQPTRRAAKSLSIFLSLEPIPELKAKAGVTTQTSEPRGGSANATGA